MRFDSPKLASEISFHRCVELCKGKSFYLAKFLYSLYVRADLQKIGQNRLIVQNCTVNRTQNCVVVFGIEDSENQAQKFCV